MKMCLSGSSKDDLVSVLEEVQVQLGHLDVLDIASIGYPLLAVGGDGETPCIRPLRSSSIERRKMKDSALVMYLTTILVFFFVVLSTRRPRRPI